MLAEKIGEDATPYEKEADKILKAMNERLWIKDKGHWPSFKISWGISVYMKALVCGLSITR